MSTAHQLTVLAHDPCCEATLRSGRHLRVLHHPDLSVAEEALNIFVMVMASALPDVANFVKVANRRHQLRGLLVHVDQDERWIGQLLDRAQLRTLRNLLVHRGDEQPRRVLEAWRAGAQRTLIADAVALPDRLLVLDCALKRIEVPFDRLPVLDSLSSAQRAAFEVDIDGSYLYWPDADLHLDLDTLLAVVDEGTEARRRLEQVRTNRHIGDAVRRLRTKKGLSRSELMGLSSRQVQRIEQGKSTPRASTLGKLANAHGMALEAYLNDLALCR